MIVTNLSNKDCIKAFWLSIDLGYNPDIDWFNVGLYWFSVKLPKSL